MSDPQNAAPQNITPQTIDNVREQVRHALEHLYDADVLANHWLTQQLRLTHLPTGSRKVRQTLIDSIQSMRPTQGEPPGSQRWLLYQVLLQRYVQQIGANALAEQHGFSSRTLRRLQRRALAQLAEIVLLQILNQEEIALTSSLSFPHTSTTEEPHASNATPGDAAPTSSPSNHQQNHWIQTVEDEIGWMRDAALSEAVDAAKLLGEALETIAPLARATHVKIDNNIPAILPEVSIHPSGLRQVLLSVLNNAVKVAANGKVTISASSVREGLTVTISSIPAARALPMSLPEPQMIVARRILSVFGGQITQRQGQDGALCVEIALMVAGGTPVMVVDDNADVLQLYERYALGTRFRLTLCQKAEVALQMAATQQPKLIIIDIMMPGLDGWSLLGQLCHHPATAAIPVIVSTIVSERDLALTLGAVDFVQKPATRRDFLDALSRWAGKGVPEAR